MPNNADVPSLDSLRVFLSVVDARGFRSASKQLGLSPSTVSEKIADLEQQLGVPLLTRTTRSVVPTEAGRALATRMAPLLAEARAALQDAVNSEAEVRGLLRLNVTGAVMVDILPPLLDRFLNLHPLVRVEIVVEDRLVDIVAAGCDAGIRYGEHLAKDMIAVPIGPKQQALAYAAAPSYLAGRPAPQCPRNLMEHDAIRLRFSSGSLVAWEFERDHESITIDLPGKLIIGWMRRRPPSPRHAPDMASSEPSGTGSRPIWRMVRCCPYCPSGGRCSKARDCTSPAASSQHRCGPLLT